MENKNKISENVRKRDEVLRNSDIFYFDCRVISRNIITDFIQGIRNFLGLELKAYTNVIDTTVRELQAKINTPLKWFRIDIEQMTRGSFLISIYGEKE